MVTRRERVGGGGEDAGERKGKKVKKAKGGSLKGNDPVNKKKMGTRKERVTMGN